MWDRERAESLFVFCFPATPALLSLSPPSTPDEREQWSDIVAGNGDGVPGVSGLGEHRSKDLFVASSPSAPHEAAATHPPASSSQHSSSPKTHGMVSPQVIRRMRSGGSRNSMVVLIVVWLGRVWHSPSQPCEGTEGLQVCALGLLSL